MTQIHNLYTKQIKVHRAVEQLLSLPNALGQVNEGVLVQEFLRGPE